MPDRDGSQSVAARRQAAGARRVASLRVRGVRVSDVVRVAAGLAVWGFAGLAAPAPVAAQAAGRAEAGGAPAIEKTLRSKSVSSGMT